MNQRSFTWYLCIGLMAGAGGVSFAVLNILMGTINQRVSMSEAEIFNYLLFSFLFSSLGTYILFIVVVGWGRFHALSIVELVAISLFLSLVLIWLLLTTFQHSPLFLLYLMATGLGALSGLILGSQFCIGNDIDDFKRVILIVVLFGSATCILTINNVRVTAPPQSGETIYANPGQNKKNPSPVGPYDALDNLNVLVNLVGVITNIALVVINSAQLSQQRQ